MEIKARKDDRGYALIANFSGGYTQGWKMAVPEAFKEALDIKLTARVYAKKKEMRWTQGNIYDFHEGDTFYDTKLAYGKWSEGLKVLKICVQVQFATSSGYVIYESVTTKDKELNLSHQKGKAKPKDITIEDGLQIKKQRIDHGHVRFKVYRPNKEKTKLEECEVIECTQDNFVAFLQSGVVRTKDNEKIDLLK